MSLYELLTGRPPLQGQNDVDTLRRIVAEEPVPPTWLRPDLARDLEAVCLQCLEKEPHRRYAGAAALGRDLNGWLRGEPIQARPAGVARRALKWARRRPTTAALLAVSAAALVAVLAGVGWHSVELGKINNELEKANGDLATANSDLRELAARERQQALHLRRLLYANEFKLSVQARQKGEHAQVVERLDDLRPGAGAEDLRGFWLSARKTGSSALLVKRATFGALPDAWFVGGDANECTSRRSGMNVRMKPGEIEFHRSAFSVDVQYPPTQQLESRTPIHLPLYGFQPIDLALDRAIAPLLRDRRLGRRLVLPDALREVLHLGYR